MKRILTSIWFLALTIAIPVVIVFPQIFSKYKASLLSQESNNSIIDHIYFEDLNGDGIREKISCHQNSAGKLAFLLHSRHGAVINQQNFNNNYFYRTHQLYFGDIDQDKQLEIYGFTLNGDSLFLNWFEPSSNYVTQKSTFISRLSTFDNGKFDISIIHFEVVDIENDGENEILISIEAGYSIHPRVLIVFRPSENKIIRSADRGINCYSPFLFDLNNDGISEIITSSAASDNLFSATGVPNVDDRPWLQVYNSNLTDFFKPVSFSKGLSNTTQTFVANDGENDLIVFNCNRGRNANEIIQVYKFDKNGSVKDSTYLSDYGKDFNFKVFQTGSQFLFFAGDEVLWINNDLKVTQSKKITLSTSIVATNTLTGVKQPYYIARAPELNKLNVFIEDFNEVVVLQFENENILSVITNVNKGSDSFFVRTDNNEYYYKLQRNSYYYLKYPVFVFIYLFSVFFIWFIQMIREKQLSERFELQYKVRELQLQSINNQLDPHFIFNTFNTLASVIKQGRSNDAYSLMLQFSKLVRQNMEGSGDIYTTLKKELDFVGDYLSIQKFRFKDLFEYHIEVDDNVITNIRIPKLLIQIHVENALKHGIRLSKKQGILIIRLKKEDGFILVEVEDNGVGRKKSKELNTKGHGIGLKAISEIIGLNNQNNNIKISQEIIDLENEDGNAAGTKVLLKIMV